MDVVKLETLNNLVYYKCSRPNKIFFPGLFKGNMILFVGQNPGRPFKPTQDCEIHHKILPDYADFKTRHDISYNNSIFFSFLKKFAMSEFNVEENMWSFTNLIKFSTNNNRLTSMTATDLANCIKILKKQIEVIAPINIVAFGKFVCNTLKDNGINFIGYYHPAYFRYNKTERINV